MAGDRRRADALGGETEDERHARGEQRVYELLADGRNDRQLLIESRFAIQSVTMCVRSDNSERGSLALLRSGRGVSSQISPVAGCEW